jgi:hypothetical protein
MKLSVYVLDHMAWNGRMTDELERIWKEQFVAYRGTTPELE